ncbi:MAG TPA: sensor histidine kinase [Nostocaceae cyanobacterium]|nr:sensor histidine kinase [Nostocaceae cyanobacterium]
MMHFKFSPKILYRLGEELVPNSEQGILELVKNSYDADATECKIEIINTEGEDGSIIISDNGIGMDINDIQEGWLVLGRSKKAAGEKTALGRLPVGDKGLGRLAAMRQGSKVILKTRPKMQPGFEYSLTINWHDFQDADVVENVLFNIQTSSTDKPHGTEIIISGISKKFDKSDIKRLAREILLLADPFDNSVAFRPQLIVAEFPEIEKQVNHSYFNNAEYHLQAHLNSSGIAEATLFDWKGDILFHADHDTLSPELYTTPPAEFELWVFLLNPQNFSTRNTSVSVKEVRKWLEQVGNVHLYHRGLRVKPYGDPGDDWLKLNYARARNPEVRPSTSTVIGRVIVNDPNDQLVQKTDRIGFIENEDFLQLKKFATDVLNWMANERLKTSEQQREIVKKQSNSDVEQAKIQIEEVIAAEVPQEVRAKVLKVVQQYEVVKERETQTLREDLQLYRSLATAGTTAAVFAHEAGKPVDLIEKVARRIEYKGREILAEKYDQFLKDPVSKLYEISQSLLRFSKFPLHLLKQEKRRLGVINVHSIIDDIVDLFKPLFEDSKIEVCKIKVDSEPSIYGSTAIMEAIITNFLTNSINAFNAEGGRTQERKIIIKTEIDSNYLILSVLDNGLGIRNIKIEDIWLPGKTTRQGGTGLGLTIVRDSVNDLRGSVESIAKNELGGATFIVKLPLMGE